MRGRRGCGSDGAWRDRDAERGEGGHGQRDEQREGEGAGSLCRAVRRSTAPFLRWSQHQPHVCANFSCGVVGVEWGERFGGNARRVGCGSSQRLIAAVSDRTDRERQSQCECDRSGMSQLDEWSAA